MDILFWELLLLNQIFFSPQVQQSVTISNKHGIYELPDELPKDLRLRISGNSCLKEHFFAPNSLQAPSNQFPW